MDSVLAAAGILLAVLGVLYGLWYPEVASALNVDTSVNALDAKPARDTVRQALLHRALPLTAGSVLLSLLLLPPVLSVISGTFRHLASRQAISLETYDAVGAFLVAVELFAIFLAAQTILISVRLRKVQKALPK